MFGTGKLSSHKGIYHIPFKNWNYKTNLLRIYGHAYNEIKDKITGMERVEYNTAIKINVMGVDDIEYFELFYWP